MNLTAGTIVNSTNTTFSTSDVTLTQGVWLLNMGYYLYPTVINGCFDIHIDISTPTSGTFTTIGTLPNFNSEGAYSSSRHSYLTTTQLINVTSSTATVHPRLYHVWCIGSSYTIGNATLSMIATKVR
jgi:hypothetical protein